MEGFLRVDRPRLAASASEETDCKQEIHEIKLSGRGRSPGISFMIEADVGDERPRVVVSATEEKINKTTTSPFVP